MNESHEIVGYWSFLQKYLKIQPLHLACIGRTENIVDHTELT